MTQTITFPNGAWQLHGILHLPPDFSQDGRYPALVFGNPGGSVKEQTPSAYAEMLAEAGFVVVIFDSSHQGESEGEPRLLDNPTERAEDIRCAVDFLTTLPYVDHKRIGAVGQCAGAGFVIFAALTDRRIGALCGLCCTNPGSTTRLGWDGRRTREENIRVLDEIAKQRTQEANGAPVKYVHYVPEADEINEATYPDMVDGNRYYRDEARHPNSPNLFRFTGLANRMTFDAYEFIPRYLDRPFLVIAGSEAGSLWQSEDAFELARCPKELFIVEGATHFDFYDNPECMREAARKLIDFFSEALPPTEQ